MSRRSKGKLAGCWVADSIVACDLYAGPEIVMLDARKGPVWVQCLVYGISWDLTTPPDNHRTYRCIGTREGHILTHLLLRVWPNNLEQNHRIASYRYRPPGGLASSDYDRFTKQVQDSLSTKGALLSRGRGSSSSQAAN